MDPLLPIGRSARSCRLSIKALRHYDDLGLLRPSHVDRTTGYRSYRRSQVRAAITIALLRSLGVPLPRIREVLTACGPAALQEALARERERAERELTRARRTLAAIERMLREGSPAPRLEVLRGGRCAVTTHVGPYEELPLAHHALLAWVQERGHEEAGAVREYYIDDPREVDAAKLRTEVLLPVTLA
jgi:DNA-binding transcriptional MerR regulator